MMFEEGSACPVYTTHDAVAAIMKVSKKNSLIIMLYVLCLGPVWIPVRPCEKQSTTTLTPTGSALNSYTWLRLV